MDAISNKMLEQARVTYLISIVLLIACAAAVLLSLYAGRKLKQQAFTDPLTGLSNRLHFESILHENATNSEQRVAKQMVAFFDIKRFRHINDSHGHAMGDQVLQHVADRIRQSVGDGAVISRLGSDEFALFNTGLSDEFDPEHYIRNVVDEIKKTLVIDNTHFQLSATAGYAISPDETNAGIALLKCADIARYRQAGIDRTTDIFRYNSSFGEQFRTRQRLESELPHALERKQFEIHYQPKVDANNGTVRSVEALLRWRHPELGQVSPAQFIPVAEDMGLLGKIGDWVLHRSCKDIAGLQQNGLSGLGVAVNISAQQFTDAGFQNKVTDALRASGLAANYLELEVTESLVMNDIEHVTNLLGSLRNQGMTIAIDDFGTGYSCLQHLQILPLDTLKIDRAFVRDLQVTDSEEDEQSSEQSMVSSIINLGAIFDLGIVAEGVETVEQLSCLQDLGADLIQGYYFSPPVAFIDLKETILDIEHRCSEKQRSTAESAQPDSSALDLPCQDDDTLDRAA